MTARLSLWRSCSSESAVEFEPESHPVATTFSGMGGGWRKLPRGEVEGGGAGDSVAMGDEEVEVGEGRPQVSAASTERKPLLSLQMDMEESRRMGTPPPQDGIVPPAWMPQL